MGLLIAEGCIDTQQYWPTGESDADTTHVTVRRFLYASSGDASRASQTDCFDRAQIRGRVARPALDERHRITVRYQGIDAPELHYQGVPRIARDDPHETEKRAAFRLVNKRYRQYYAETSTWRLERHLASFTRKGSSSVACRVMTRVDHPNDVFDSEGRFVGEIFVGDHQNLNVWLVENGWAFPTFYSSMHADEIQRLIDAAHQAKRRGVWEHYKQTLTDFDYLTFRRDFRPVNDAGSVILPKLFRRMVDYRTNHRAKIIEGGFLTYLENEKSPETCFETKDFLAHGRSGAQRKRLADLMDGMTFEARPEGLVFDDAPSTLLDAKGERVTAWF